MTAADSGEPVTQTDLPVLAALAEVTRPPVDSAGARFLRSAFSSGVDGVPNSDAEVWAVWVDLGLWEQSAVHGPVDLTAHARTDLAAVAVRLARSGASERDDRSRSGLSADQDARLRTLAALRELGDLSPELQQLRRSYRDRDQRADVRPPAPVVWPAQPRSGGSA